MVCIDLIRGPPWFSSSGIHGMYQFDKGASVV